MTDPGESFSIRFSHGFLVRTVCLAFYFCVQSDCVSKREYFEYYGVTLHSPCGWNKLFLVFLISCFTATSFHGVLLLN